MCRPLCRKGEMTDDPLRPLWDKYKRGDKAAGDELLTALDPHIQQRVALYKGRVAIPHHAIEGHAKGLALYAMDTFDPKAGTLVSTHVVNHLHRVSRYVNQNKNVARIPEHRMLRVGTFESAKSQMSAALGREPTMEELADDLGWSRQEVQTMQKSLSSRTLSASAMPDTLEGEFSDRHKETLNFVRFGLTPKEREAFDMMFGFNGVKAQHMDDVAKKTGLSTDYLYRMRRRIQQETLRYS